MTAKFLNDTGINPALEEDREKESETDKAQNPYIFWLMTISVRLPVVYFDLWCWHVPVTQSTYAKLTTASL